jgi:hypothetical protein
MVATVGMVQKVQQQEVVLVLIMVGLCIGLTRTGGAINHVIM